MGKNALGRVISPVPRRPRPSIAGGDPFGGRLVKRCLVLAAGVMVSPIGNRSRAPVGPERVSRYAGIRPEIHRQEELQGVPPSPQRQSAPFILGFVVAPALFVLLCSAHSPASRSLGFPCAPLGALSHEASASTEFCVVLCTRFELVGPALAELWPDPLEFSPRLANLGLSGVGVGIAWSGFGEFRGGEFRPK